MKAHENVLVFYRKMLTYNPQKTTGHKPFGAVKPCDNIPKPEKKRNYNHLSKTFGNDGKTTDRYPRDVQKFPVINNDSPFKFHPTQKPEEMIEYFIKTYSNEGEVILDNCMGSDQLVLHVSTLIDNTLVLRKILTATRLPKTGLKHISI